MTWWAVGTAVVGAVASKQQADAANKKKTSWTDQTTTQNPYFAGQMNPDIEEVLKYQRGLIQQGAPTLNSKGQLVYGAVPQGSRPGPPDSYSGADPRIRNGPQPGPGVPHPTGPGNVDKGANQNKPVFSESTVGGTGSGSKGRAATAATWVNKQGETMTTGPNGKPMRVATGTPTTAAPAGPNLSTPTGIFSEVAKRGLDAGNTETQTGARNLMSNIWGAAGKEGGSSGPGSAELTGFEGYNPILDRQAQRLEQDAGTRTGRDLLLGFLGENNRAGAANPASGGGGAAPMGRNVAYAPQGTKAAKFAALTGAGGTNGGTGGSYNPNANGVPDTMAVDSYFGDETRKIMDEQANEAEIEALIQSMNEDTEKGMFRDMAQLDAAAAGSGRFGGDMWKGMSVDAREEALQEMNKTASGVRMGDREGRRNARLAALSGVNQRDLGLLGANVQREGIEASERSANAGAGASAQAAADQIELAKRGQDLAAISDLLGYEQFGMGQLTNIGGQLSGDRLGSLGMVPGLEGVGLNGLNAALGAGGGMVDMRGQDVQKGIAGQQANIARQGLNQQLGMWNAGQQQNAVNNYLGTLMNIGQMGGTSRTQGQNVQPGLGISSTGAAIQGGIGGALAGYQIGQQYRGGY